MVLNCGFTKGCEIEPGHQRGLLADLASRVGQEPLEI